MYLLYIICIKLPAPNSFVGNFFFVATLSSQTVFVCSDQIFDCLYEDLLLDKLLTIKLSPLISLNIIA